jgi:PAS domain S-box-containing protein
MTWSDATMTLPGLELQGFLDTVIEAVRDGVYVLDVDGRLRFINEAAERILGWTRDELHGRPMHELIHALRGDGTPHPDGESAITRARDGGEPVRVERDVFTHRDGSLIPVTYTASPFRTAAGDRSQVIVFNDFGEQQARERRLLADADALRCRNRIQDALREDRFELHAQPIVCLRTGATVRHELLLRMRSPEGETILPGEFLPVAEASGLIREIDRLVIRRALRYAGDGHAVSLNISANALGDLTLLAYVDGELRVHAVDPALVVFEITETALVEDEAAAEAFVRAISARGCGVALDDFGTGYGGFRYLKRLPVSSLKIDREFVTELEPGSADHHVVDAIVRLAKGLGLQTVAEGIESLDTLDRLRALGVDHVQGFALGRPRPADEAFGTAPARPTA